MTRIILDTNVLVSALISNSHPYIILKDFVLSGRVETCLSEPIFEEYIKVLKRDKFSKFPSFIQNADIVLRRIGELSKIFEPVESVDILTDRSDNKFLELAAISEADFLITRNTNDFTIPIFRNTRIVTPKDFCSLMQ